MKNSKILEFELDLRLFAQTELWEPSVTSTEKVNP